MRTVDTCEQCGEKLSDEIVRDEMGRPFCDEKCREDYETDERLVCPMCGERGERVKFFECDRGVDPQTGYRNAGLRFECAACRMKGDMPPED